jgi:hypothetical protein
MGYESFYEPSEIKDWKLKKFLDDTAYWERLAKVLGGFSVKDFTNQDVAILQGPKENQFVEIPRFLAEAIFDAFRFGLDAKLIKDKS